MRQHRLLRTPILIALALLCLAGSSSAQTNSRYTAGVMFGFGATVGSGPAGSDDIYLVEDRFDFGYQFLFGMEAGRGVLFGLRLGQMDVEIASPSRLALFGAPVESELTYLTLSGEYPLLTGPYRSGLFLGAGYYSVDGQDTFDDDSGLGLTIGTTGDFRPNDRWSILVEFSGHYADLDYAQFFIMGHAGLAFHF